METKQKTVTIEIPEGKKAVWNEQGVLQLVDDPKDITERIKTLYDAQCELAQWAERGDCEAKQLIEEYNSVQTEGTSDDIVAYLQLRIITAALNEGWKPQFKEDEVRWFPFLVLWSKDEIDNMSDEEKDNRQLLQWDYSAYGGRIFVLDFARQWEACECERQLSPLLQDTVLSDVCRTSIRKHIRTLFYRR